MALSFSDIPYFIVAIALLIAVHEFGHFWVARRLGFKVLRFSIGFGRPLWRWRGGGPDETEYWLSAIPLGGYVKMLDEREGPVAEEEQHRAFNRRPIPHRIAVLLAGPAFNFLFAICAYWALFVVGVPGLKPFVGEVSPNSPAAQAGLTTETLILTVDDSPVDTWQDTIMALLDSILDGGVTDLGVVDASGDRHQLALDLRGKSAELTKPDALFSGIGVMPMIPATLGSVVSGEPADFAGFQPGDRVTAANGEPIAGWSQWVRFLRARPGETVTVQVRRDGALQNLQLTIGMVEENGENIGRIGVAQGTMPEEFVAEQRYPLGQALSKGLQETWGMSTLTLRMLWRMVTGDVSLKNLSGPIKIASYAGQSGKRGANSFIEFLALISISLGIINLLPIPLLDGGQIVYQLVEAAKGSPPSDRSLILGQQVGILLLLAIMGLVFYNDLSPIFAN